MPIFRTPPLTGFAAAELPFEPPLVVCVGDPPPPHAVARTARTAATAVARQVTLQVVRHAVREIVRIPRPPSAGLPIRVRIERVAHPVPQQVERERGQEQK